MSGFKKHFVSLLAQVFYDDAQEPCRIELITPAGRISGRAFPESKRTSFSETVSDIVEMYDNHLSDDEGYILLEDVVLSSAGVDTWFQSLVVFFDQIIAAAIAVE